VTISNVQTNTTRHKASTSTRWRSALLLLLFLLRQQRQHTDTMNTDD